MKVLKFLIGLIGICLVIGLMIIAIKILTIFISYLDDNGLNFIQIFIILLSIWLISFFIAIREEIIKLGEDILNKFKREE